MAPSNGLVTSLGPPIKVFALGKPFDGWKIPNYPKDRLQPSTKTASGSFPLTYAEFFAGVNECNVDKKVGGKLKLETVQALWMYAVNTHFGHEKDEYKLKALITTFPNNSEQIANRVKTEGDASRDYDDESSEDGSIIDLYTAETPRPSSIGRGWLSESQSGRRFSSASVPHAPRSMLQSGPHQDSEANARHEAHAAYESHINHPNQKPDNEEARTEPIPPISRLYGDVLTIPLDGTNSPRFAILISGMEAWTDVLRLKIEAWLQDLYPAKIEVGSSLSGSVRQTVRRKYGVTTEFLRVAFKSSQVQTRAMDTFRLKHLTIQSYPRRVERGISKIIERLEPEGFLSELPKANSSSRRDNTEQQRNTRQGAQPRIDTRSQTRAETRILSGAAGNPDPRVSRGSNSTHIRFEDSRAPSLNDRTPQTNNQSIEPCSTPGSSLSTHVSWSTKRSIGLRSVPNVSNATNKGNRQPLDTSSPVSAKGTPLNSKRLASHERPSYKTPNDKKSPPNQRGNGTQLQPAVQSEEDGDGDIVMQTSDVEVVSEQKKKRKAGSSYQEMETEETPSVASTSKSKKKKKTHRAPASSGDDKEDDITMTEAPAASSQLKDKEKKKKKSSKLQETETARREREATTSLTSIVAILEDSSCEEIPQPTRSKRKHKERDQSASSSSSDDAPPPSLRSKGKNRDKKIGGRVEKEKKSSSSSGGSGSKSSRWARLAGALRDARTKLSGDELELFEAIVARPA